MVVCWPGGLRGGLVAWCSGVLVLWCSGGLVVWWSGGLVVLRPGGLGGLGGLVAWWSGRLVVWWPSLSSLPEATQRSRSRSRSRSRRPASARSLHNLNFTRSLSAPRGDPTLALALALALASGRLGSLPNYFDKSELLLDVRPLLPVLATTAENLLQIVAACLLPPILPSSSRKEILLPITPNHCSHSAVASSPHF